MTLDEAISFIAQQNAEEVTTAMQKSANAVWQNIFNKGHSTATVAARTEKDQLTGKVTSLETAVAEKEIKIKELETKSPDVAAIHRQYQEKITGMENTHRTELANRDGVIATSRKSAVKSAIRKEAEKLGLDPDWLELQMDKPENDRRIVVKADGSYEIMQPEGNIPLMPAGEDKPETLIAKEILAKAPDKWKNVQTDSGAGINSNLPGGGQKKAAGTAKYDKIREDAKKAAADRKAVTPATLGERMGMTKTTT
jgi:hypothetical protein